MPALTSDSSTACAGCGCVREAAAAVQEVAVPLDDMDFSARTHDLYANAECAVCLAGFTADDGRHRKPTALAVYEEMMRLKNEELEKAGLGVPSFVVEEGL